MTPAEQLEAGAAASFRLTRDAFAASAKFPAILQKIAEKLLASAFAAGLQATYPEAATCTLTLEKRMTHSYTVLIGEPAGDPLWQLRMLVVLEHFMVFANIEVTLQGLDYASNGQRLYRTYGTEKATVTLSESPAGASSLDLVLSQLEQGMPFSAKQYLAIGEDLLEHCTP